MEEPAEYLALQVLMMPKDANGMPSAVKENMPIGPHLTICGTIGIGYIGGESPECKP